MTRDEWQELKQTLLDQNKDDWSDTAIDNVFELLDGYEKINDSLDLWDEDES